MRWPIRPGMHHKLRETLHTENSMALKMCLFLHILENKCDYCDYSSEPICLRISAQTCQRLGMMCEEQYDKKNILFNTYASGNFPDTM